MDLGSKARRGTVATLAIPGQPGAWVAGLCIVAFALVVAVFLQRSLGHALANGDASSGDQAGYLRLALKVAAGRGFSNGNYHPLLPWALQPLVTRDWGFFTTAKLFGIGVGAAGMGLVFVAGWRLLGPAAALAAAAALAWNGEYVTRAARTEPDVLLTALFFTAWVLWTHGGAGGQRRRVAAGAAGVVAALAYMAKGTGQFLPLGFVALALLRRGRRGVADRTLWLMVGLYLVAASPLLVDNTREFGQPFYDFASVHAMWYDDWDDRYLSPGGTHATAVTYLRTHSPGQVADRLVSGLAMMPAMWRRAALPGVDTAGEWAVVVALALLAMAGAAAAVGGARPAPVLRTAILTFAALFGPTYVFFGWYLPVIASPRFELPLVPAAYLIAAALASRGLLATASRIRGFWVGVASGPRRAGARARTARVLGIWNAEALLAAMTAVVVAAASVSALAQGQWTTPGAIRAADGAANADSVAVFDYLSGPGRPGGTVILGPKAGLATWPFYGLVDFEPIPSTVTDAAGLADFMADEGSRTVVLAPGTVAARKELLGGAFTVTGEAVAFDELPPGWRLQLAVPEVPCRFCIFGVEVP